MKILVNFESDWADEFTVHGFAIMEIEVWNDQVEKFKSGHPDAIEGWYFGSNEGFDEITEDRDYWLQNYTIHSIGESTAAALIELFHLYKVNDEIYEYGNFPQLLEC